MPLMLLIGSIAFFLQYYAQKYMILRWYRTPKYTNGTINKTVMFLCEIAIILHVAFSCYMYGCDDIFPYNVEAMGLDIFTI